MHSEEENHTLKVCWQAEKPVLATVVMAALVEVEVLNMKVAVCLFCFLKRNSDIRSNIL